jgi:hypothetical protein
MINRKTNWVIVFGLLFLVTACVQQDIASINQGASNLAGETGGDNIPIQDEGLGPIEITPDADIGESNADQESQDNGIVSSSGKSSSKGLQSADPGYIDSVAPESSGPDQNENLTVDWLTYNDQTYSFSIDYPSIYIVLPEQGGPSSAYPGVVHKVQFQDVQLATGDTADFELPIFIVEVFELGGKSLEALIAQIEPDGRLDAYQGNNLDGFRVSYKQLIAPNEFFFFSSPEYAYKLTPLGPFSPEMVQSFTIQK